MICLEYVYKKYCVPFHEYGYSIFFFQEIALDVFLHVYWEDPRIWILGNASQVELTWDKDPKFWIPDLYIRQLREMKVLTLFQDLASIRLYDNSTLRISIG